MIDFCTQQFLIFFLSVFAAYWLLPWRRLRLSLDRPALLSGRLRLVLRGDEMRVWLLLGASFYFYASWSPKLAWLICASTFLDYWLALGIDTSSSERVRKGLLTISVVANLSLLGMFKYANFFLDSLQQSLQSVGVRAAIPVLSLLLPVGISFYTFEAINYMVEVYRRNVRAERNLAHFMLFILFFPHLVAGPIVRARDFLPQVRRSKRWSWARFQVGLEYVVLGLLKKWVVADRMAAFVDPVFADPAVYHFSTGATWVGLIAYALQLYGDFSGYSDMAQGLAHMLGYRLAVNFNMPFVALNINDHWRRWHISLSSWLRDYLFIPLGGSRGSKWKTARNLMITMTLGGLWHGAAWHYVLWGGLQGVLLVGHRHFRSFCEGRPRLDWVLRSLPGTALRMAVTFFVVCLGYVLFRATTMEGAGLLLQRLLWPHAGLPTPLPMQSFWFTLTGVVLFHVGAHAVRWKWVNQRVPTFALGMGYAAAVMLCLVLAPEGERHFIYFLF
jgi:alginate O-acetyltransferase complex protein AlgI